MAEISEKAWGNVSGSDYEDAAAYCKACLIDMNEPGAEKVMDKCKLPVREPGGMVNRNAVHAAAAALAGARGGVKVPADEKRKAAGKLVRMYRMMDEEPPESMRQMMGGR